MKKKLDIMCKVSETLRGLTFNCTNEKKKKFTALKAQNIGTNGHFIFCTWAKDMSRPQNVTVLLQKLI